MKKNNTKNFDNSLELDLTDFEFIDDFSAILYESVDVEDYDFDTFKQRISDCKLILARIGLPLNDSININVIIQDGTNITAGIRATENHCYDFFIARPVIRKAKDMYWDTIILHELCHILQLEYLFNKGQIYYSNGRLKASTLYAKTAVSENHGHTNLWYLFVQIVNSKIELNIPVSKELTREQLEDVLLENTLSEIYDVTNWHKGMI